MAISPAPSLSVFPTQPSMDLVASVGEGLPFDLADRLAAVVAPGDAGFKYRLMPKATYARRKAGRRLSPQEGERLVRLARIWEFAIEVWKDEAAARKPWPVMSSLA